MRMRRKPGPSASVAVSTVKTTHESSIANITWLNLPYLIKSFLSDAG